MTTTISNTTTNKNNNVPRGQYFNDRQQRDIYKIGKPHERKTLKIWKEISVILPEVSEEFDSPPDPEQLKVSWRAIDDYFRQLERNKDPVYQDSQRKRVRKRGGKATATSNNMKTTASNTKGHNPNQSNIMTPGKENQRDSNKIRPKVQRWNEAQQRRIFEVVPLYTRDEDPGDSYDTWKGIALSLSYEPDVFQCMPDPELLMLSWPAINERFSSKMAPEDQNKHDLISILRELEVESITMITRAIRQCYPHLSSKEVKGKAKYHWDRIQQDAEELSEQDDWMKKLKKIRSREIRNMEKQAKEEAEQARALAKEERARADEQAKQRFAFEKDQLQLQYDLQARIQEHNSQVHERMMSPLAYSGRMNGTLYHGTTQATPIRLFSPDATNNNQQLAPYSQGQPYYGMGHHAAQAAVGGYHPFGASTHYAQAPLQPQGTTTQQQFAHHSEEEEDEDDGNSSSSGDTVEDI